MEILSLSFKKNFELKTCNIIICLNCFMMLDINLFTKNWQICITGYHKGLNESNVFCWAS